MNNDTMTQLKDVLKQSQTSLKQCGASYKVLLYLAQYSRGNHQQIAFCTEQLHSAAGALRDAAEHLTVISQTIYTNARDMAEQMDLHDMSLDGPS
jgi:hypothetical protein